MRRFTDNRQSAAAQPADDPDPLIAAEELGTISLDVAELRRLCDRLHGRCQPEVEAPLGSISGGRDRGTPPVLSWVYAPLEFDEHPPYSNPQGASMGNVTKG